MANDKIKYDEFEDDDTSKKVEKKQKISYTLDEDKEATGEANTESTEEAFGDTQQPNNKEVDDIPSQNAKILMTIGYFGILVVIPLISEECKNNKLIRKHINQSILLLLYEVITGLISSSIGWVNKVLSLNALVIAQSAVSGVFGVIGFIFLILQLVALWNNKENELPLFGHINIYK